MLKEQEAKGECPLLETEELPQWLGWLSRSETLTPTTATLGKRCCLLYPTLSWLAGASHWQKLTAGKGIWKIEQHKV